MFVHAIYSRRRPVDANGANVPSSAYAYVWGVIWFRTYDFLCYIVVRSSLSTRKRFPRATPGATTPPGQGKHEEKEIIESVPPGTVALSLVVPTLRTYLDISNLGPFPWPSLSVL